MINETPKKKQTGSEIPIVGICRGLHEDLHF